jgi:hypothetical protein
VHVTISKSGGGGNRTRPIRSSWRGIARHRAESCDLLRGSSGRLALSRAAKPNPADSVDQRDHGGSTRCDTPPYSSGYEATDEGLQAGSSCINPLESVDSLSGVSAPQMQAGSSEHKNFGQPVVSEHPAILDDGCHVEGLLTPAQAAAEFHIPEYLLRRACFEGRLEHLRVVNALWLTPVAVAAFARSWRAKRGGKDT